MASVNRVILIGRLGDEPAVHTTDKGTIANLSVATTENWKTKDGERKEHIEWHRVVLYGQPAKFAEGNLHKGSQVYVEGRIQTRKWEDKSGNERTTTEVVADRIKALGKKESKDEEIPY